MTNTAVLKEKKSKADVLNDIDALERIIEDLNGDVVELNKRRITLESQIASLRYQIDNERSEVMTKANIERQEKLKQVMDFENTLKVRQKAVADEEVRLADLRKQLERDQLVVGDLAKRFAKLDVDRIQIERMRLEAKSLMDEALTKKAEADNIFQEYRNAILDLEKKQKNIERRDNEVNQRLGEASARESALNERITYYEGLVELVEKNMKIKEKEEK